MTTNFTGSITALITPFKNANNNIAVDYKAFEKFVDWQIKEGTNGLVPCGTTGESPTLDFDEHNKVVEACVKAAKGRVPVIAGTGANSTEEAIFLSKHAEKAGADALLIVAPYYNKPTQEGLFQHYKALNDAVNIPIILYNVPGRSVADIQNSTVERLLNLKNIMGMKDATGDLERISLLRPAFTKKKDFCYLGGDDSLALPFAVLGACGTISVTSNVAPKLCAQLQKHLATGDYTEALKIHDKLTPLNDAMFAESSPGPVKYAAKLLGLCDGTVKLPLVEISKETEEVVKKAMKHAGLI
jgi:4-hydroxy-tetrahydrodipicolinate synthase